MTNYVLIIAVVAVISIGQLLFKTVGLKMGERGFSVLYTDPSAAMLFLTSLALYGVATFGWIWALRQVPLTTAYLFMSLGFVLVPVMAHFVFGEAVTLRFAAGTLLIISGILLASTA